MNGLMMQKQLLISSLIVHADRHHGDTEIVSRRVEGDIHRYTFRDCHRRARQMASALTTPGCQALRPDRHAGMEWLSSPGAVLRRLRHGCHSAYHQPSPA